MESPLQCENLLKMNENLQKIDDNLLKVGEGVKNLDINENNDHSSAEEVIGEQAINSIHLPYKHISMKSGKNLRSKLLRVSIAFEL